MRRRGEYGRLSEGDRLEVGDRIKSGQTHAEVAVAVGCFATALRCMALAVSPTLDASRPPCLMPSPA